MATVVPKHFLMRCLGPQQVLFYSSITLRAGPGGCGASFPGPSAAPFDDFPVVPAKESLRNSPSAVVRRAGVMGEIQQRADLLARCAIRRVPGLARIGL